MSASAEYSELDRGGHEKAVLPTKRSATKRKDFFQPLKALLKMNLFSEARATFATNFLIQLKPNATLQLRKRIFIPSQSAI